MCLPSKLPSNSHSLFQTTSSLDLKEQIKQHQQTFIPCDSTDCPFRQNEDGNHQSTKRKQEVLNCQAAEQNDNEEVVEKQCVKHDYHDHSKDSESAYLEKPIVTKGGVSIPFPMKLHNMLNHIALYETELSSIVSWQPHGRCFRVKKIKDFTEKVLPRFFQQRKYPSFQRQLNLYGFNRLTAGPDKGSYYHELFLRSKKALCRAINRMKVKGTGCRMASNPKEEPNFYIMEPMPSENSAEVITPPTKMMVKTEEGTRDRFPEMPPLQLPSVAVLPVPSSVKVQKTFKPPLVESTNPSASGVVKDTVEQKEERTSDAPSDLQFIFGGMPFHSLSVDFAKSPTNDMINSRRNSITLQIPISDDESTMSPMLEDVEDFERQLTHIADLGSNGDLSDLEMSDILDRIVWHEL